MEVTILPTDRSSQLPECLRSISLNNKNIGAFFLLEEQNHDRALVGPILFCKVGLRTNCIPELCQVLVYEIVLTIWQPSQGFTGQITVASSASAFIDHILIEGIGSCGSRWGESVLSLRSVSPHLTVALPILEMRRRQLSGEETSVLSLLP